MSDVTITLVILVLAVVTFVWNKFPVGIVALAVSLALYFTGVLNLSESFSGFSDPTIILIASLFVVSEGLDASGITTWAGQQVIARAGKSRGRLLILMMSVVAFLTALISVNGAVAALLPMVVVVAVRLGRSPSQLLMPLAFGAHAGSLLTLTGSPVNVLISEAAEQAPGGRAIGFFEFALVGVPLLIGSILIVVFFGEKLLPTRTARMLPRDLSKHSEDLLAHYLATDELWHLQIPSASPLIGTQPSSLEVQEYQGVSLVAVKTRAGSPMRSDELKAYDTLVLRGPKASLTAFFEAHQLERLGSANGLITESHGVAEVLVAPRSRMVGETVFPGMVTDSGELVVLAVQRAGAEIEESEFVEGQVILAPGDALLVQGTWAALDEHTVDDNVLIVDEPDSIRRQTVPLGRTARTAMIITGLMIVLLTTGLLPPAVVTLLAAIAMVLFRVVSVEKAHRSISWTTLILVAGMIPLSVAISSTGAAELIAHQVVDLIGGYGPNIVLLGLFLLTAILGQLISNTATALVLIPIAVSVATELSLSPMPLLVAVCVAASASFLTPVATPANMMVMQPAGYRFGDYWKLGLPLLGLYGIVAVLLVPIIWPF
ncbi:SLC13 family permease [Lysinibacter cavernae]|uniref:Di/tricarboxylate transporter n=1 Tax=Lysinibacter cavernae TaxID=1640652 RepID=A0A7X5R0C2_9MICO|nr:SLC13 family permease [Lysinibacter cavernae]NIH53117.1 di/tricarboxylate transporter [Lysinibacter cavernae]